MTVRLPTSIAVLVDSAIDAKRGWDQSYRVLHHYRDTSPAERARLIDMCGNYRRSYARIQASIKAEIRARFH